MPEDQRAVGVEMAVGAVVGAGALALGHRKDPLRRSPRAKVIDAGMRVSWFILESLTAAIGRASVDGSTSKTVARITMAESHTGPVARWVRL
jgi:hypothetical protein